MDVKLKCHFSNGKIIVKIFYGKWYVVKILLSTKALKKSK